MNNYKVFEWVASIPPGAKVMTATWAMKKKASGTYCARLAARGYKQVDGKHYSSNSTAAPVVCNVII
jgi:hypothetical protein